MSSNYRKPIIIHWTKETAQENEGNMRPSSSKTINKMKVKEEKIYIDKKNAERDVGDPEGQSQSGATLKQLCAEDKKRVASLIRELARLEEEKTTMAKVVEAERARFEVQMADLISQQEQSQAEKNVVQKQLLECQELLAKYQQDIFKHQEKRRIQVRQEQVSYDKTINKNSANKQENYECYDRFSNAKSKANSKKPICNDKSTSLANAVRKNRTAEDTDVTRNSGYKLPSQIYQKSNEPAINSCHRLEELHGFQEENDKAEEQQWEKYLPPVSERTHQLLMQADVLRKQGDSKSQHESNSYGTNVTATSNARREYQEQSQNFSGSATRTHHGRTECNNMTSGCDEIERNNKNNSNSHPAIFTVTTDPQQGNDMYQNNNEAPRSENSFIRRAAHTVNSERPFTTVLDQMIAEQFVDHEAQLKSSATSDNLNNYKSEPNNDREMQSAPSHSLDAKITHKQTFVDQNRDVKMIGPLKAPTMTSTLRNNQGDLKTSDGRNEMIRQKEALLDEQKRLKEVLAEQEALLKRKKEELHRQQEIQKYRMKVFEETGMFPQEDCIVLPKDVGNKMQNVVEESAILPQKSDNKMPDFKTIVNIPDKREAESNTTYHPFIESDNLTNDCQINTNALASNLLEIRNVNVQLSSENNSLKTLQNQSPKTNKKMKSVTRDTATSPFKTSQKPVINKPVPQRKVQVDSETSLIDLVDEVESEYSFYSDNEIPLYRQLKHSNQNPEQYGIDDELSELEESNLLEEIFFYK